MYCSCLELSEMFPEPSITKWLSEDRSKVTLE